MERFNWECKSRPLSLRAQAWIVGNRLELSMSQIIEPRILKGFRDILPDQQHERQRIVRILEKTVESYGFMSIDTPILEYAEVLLGKGGGETDKQVYRFADQGGRDVAMRFDLTVPFARFMAAHRHEIALPFRRYHVGKVFRGENPQRGRYREFMQCDFDIVGTDAVAADLEIVLLINSVFEAMGVGKVTIHVSHRGLFNALLSKLSVQDRIVDVLRTVDKLRKIGEEKVRSILTDLIGTEATDAVVRFITATGDNATILSSLRSLVPAGTEHVDRLQRILEIREAVDASERIRIDPAITRGLDYYTGIVFETFLDDLPEIGSVCSGGRYDNLASLYSKERMPGVGASVGMDRLMAALEELGVAGDHGSGADTLIVCLDEELAGTYQRIAKELRACGLRTEVYPEARKLAQQFAFAERKGIPTAVICGPDEAAAGTVNVRVIATRESRDGLTVSEAARFIGDLGASGSA